MKILLSALLVLLVGTQTFSIDASLAPGLSVKNALLYLAAIGVVARLIVSGRFRPQLIGLQACFVFLIAWAIFSWLVVSFVVQYPGYSPISNAFALKNVLIDFMVFFVVFFYGVQTLEEATTVSDVLLVSVVFANIITVLDASGVLGLNIIGLRDDISEVGRVQGAFGEANQHAALVAMCLPAMCARFVMSRGRTKWFWVLGAGFGLAAMLMTASRGAMVGLVVACLWGAFVFRRFFSLGRVMLWALGAAAMLGLVLLSVTDTYVELLKTRVLEQSFSSDVTEVSSGRSAIWGEMLSTMMASPWSFLTGFGWGSYSVMNFEYAPHNTYLGFWFSLGLPGFVSFSLVMLQGLAEGVRAADRSPAELRPRFIAFAIGFLALSVSVFFVELNTPWLYVWAYLGLMMRAAVCVEARDTGAAIARDGLGPEGADLGFERQEWPARDRRKRVGRVREASRFR